MEKIPDAVARFLSGEAPPPAGVTILGRWHKADFSGGFTLIECNDAVAAYTDAAQWGGSDGPQHCACARRCRSGLGVGSAFQEVGQRVTR
jgi:hypothetical protein